MTTALCPGSFDPPTHGHVDVVERASRLFEKVIVAVVKNPRKKPLFESGVRVKLLDTCLSHLPNIEVATFDGLLIDFARNRDVDVVVKGLRAVSDFERELQMAQMNASLPGGIDTFFVTTSPQWSFLSSSLVKELATYGADVSPFVSAPVMQAMARLLHGPSTAASETSSAGS